MSEAVIGGPRPREPSMSLLLPRIDISNSAANGTSVGIISATSDRFADDGSVDTNGDADRCAAYTDRAPLWRDGLWAARRSP